MTPLSETIAPNNVRNKIRFMRRVVSYVEHVLYEGFVSDKF